MEKLDLQLHPIHFISHLRQTYGTELVLRFSRYEYVPQSRRDDRISFEVPINIVDESWLREQISKLGHWQELALESRVRLANVRRHIPMLDFRGMTKGQLTAIMDVFPKEYRSGLAIYHSGRSFHAYFPHLLSQQQWIKFMGSALLCNAPSGPPVIDQRWIGHRLIAGYSALRWTCNTSHYRQYPQRIDPTLLDAPFTEKKKLLSS